MEESWALTAVAGAEAVAAGLVAVGAAVDSQGRDRHSLAHRTAQQLGDLAQAQRSPAVYTAVTTAPLQPGNTSRVNIHCGTGLFVWGCGFKSR